jgi:threonine efflux protein
VQRRSAYVAYALGVASSSPNNFAVMTTAMFAVRRSAMVLALGIVSGSTVWGMLASSGLSAVMGQCRAVIGRLS